MKSRRLENQFHQDIWGLHCENHGTAVPVTHEEVWQPSLNIKRNNESSVVRGEAAGASLLCSRVIQANVEVNTGG